MSTIKVRAVVLKETMLGESDKIVTLFAKDYGRLSVSCKGARKPKSKFLACTQLFCYSDFVLFQGKGFYSLAQCELIKSFYGVRNNLDSLSHAMHFIELTEKTLLEGEPQNDMLILLLKCLSVISKGNKNPALISKIFELRFFSYLGYRPETASCSICGGELSRNKYFDAASGGMVCAACIHSCHKPARVADATYAALDYILESSLEKLFRFDVSPQVLQELGQITKSYLRTHVDAPLRSAEFIDKMLK